MVHEIILDSWKTFTDFIENTVNNYPDISSTFIQYRGQGNSSWDLAPSLLRIVKGDEISEKKAKYYEHQAKFDFLSQVHLLDSRIHYSENVNPDSILIDMQHYSCPTRLLDWSSSPYVALYFAVNNNFDKNGALFCWDLRKYNSNFKIAFPHASSISSSAITSTEEPDYITIIFSTRKNERIVRQQGAFSISNSLLKSHDNIIVDMARKVERPSGLYKLEIPKELKLEFLARLKVMNITAESLFPGLDGLGRAISELLIIRRWQKK